MAGINFNGNYNLRLNLPCEKLDVQKGNSVENNPEVNVVATSKNVAPSDVLNVLANGVAAKGISINRDKQNQVMLNNARDAYAQAKEALENNTDPTKAEALREAANKALDAYKNALNKLADAGFLKKTTETIETRAGGKIEIEEIFDENGNILSKTEVKYDENGNVIETRVSVYEYKDGALYRTNTIVYDANNNEMQEIEENHRTGSKYVRDTIRDENGRFLGLVAKYYDEDGNLYKKNEYSCDENGVPLIGQNGEELFSRTTYYDSEGNISNGSSCHGVDFAIEEDQFGGPSFIRYYDANGKLVVEWNMDEDTNTFFEYDENGQVISEKTLQKNETYTVEDDEVLREVKYEYGENGEVTKTTTVPREDGGKIVTIEERDGDGNVVKTITENYRADGTIENRKIVENMPSDEAPAEEAPAEEAPEEAKFVVNPKFKVNVDFHVAEGISKPKFVFNPRLKN